MKKEQWKDDEYKKIMSNQSRDLWKNDEYRKKTLSFLQSEEHKKTVSVRFKNKPKSEVSKRKMSENRKNKQKVSIDGVIYDSITDASNKIPINRDKLRVRLKSKNFPEYYKIVAG
jgi:FKBP-type peptidyl-prolyl cis-trans isomerase